MTVTSEIRFRRFDPRDADAVVALDEWAMGETATNVADIPGYEDVRDVESAYLDAGGDFVVGVIECREDVMGDQAETADGRRLETSDGVVVAMGGFLPNEAGHDDERTVAGAAELHRMRVAPPCQHRGYGRQLLDELERRAVAAGYPVLLATTAKRQERALRFYPSAGYELVEESTFGEYELVHFEKRVK